MGRPPRARLPRRRLRRRRCRAADGLGGAQLEGGRQGHRAVQLRRRPGPVGPRRLHAGGEPAHLGLRVELRRAGRHHRRQGQPAHAEADASQLGGGRHQRAVQLHRLPHAGLAERGPHDAGRQGARVGRQRRPRQLRGAARAQRRRHADRRRVLAREGQAPQRSRGRGGHRPQGGGLPLLVGRAHPGRVGVAPLRQGHPRAWWAASPRSSSSTRGARRWVRRCSPASAAGRS